MPNPNVYYIKNELHGGNVVELKAGLMVTVSTLDGGAAIRNPDGENVRMLLTRKEARKLAKKILKSTKKLTPKKGKDETR